MDTLRGKELMLINLISPSIFVLIVTKDLIITILSSFLKHLH